MRTSRARRSRAPIRVVALASLALPAAAAAQGESYGPAGPGDGPAWTRHWSALVDFADLPREAPAPDLALPSMLELPDPKIGLFWTGGNPGGIPWEVTEWRAEIAARASGESGGYRRPQEPGSRRAFGLEGFGWTPLGTSGAGVGRVVVDRTDFGDGAFFDVARPYSSNPLSVVDTVGGDLRRTSARLEGAGGWRLGSLGLGLALGYTAHETRTEESAVARLNRLAYSGATGGVVYHVDGGSDLRVGVHARGQRSSEFVQLFPLSGTNRVYQLEGYRDPIPRAVQPNMGYRRHLDLEVYGGGVSVGGGGLGGSWVLVVEAGRRRDEHTLDETSDPRLDTWEADLVAARGTFGTSLGSALVTVEAGWAALDGEARLAEFDDVFHTADESRWFLRSDLRGDFGSGWRVGVVWSSERRESVRRDELARASSDIRAWTHGGGGEVVRRLSPGLAASVGGTVVVHSPGGTLPGRSDLGPVYDRFIAPGLLVEGTAATALSVEGALRWRRDAGSLMFARGRWGSVSPDLTDGRRPALLPDGNRSQWSVDLGVVLER